MHVLPGGGAGVAGWPLPGLLLCLVVFSLGCFKAVTMPCVAACVGCALLALLEPGGLAS